MESNIHLEARVRMLESMIYRLYTNKELSTGQMNELVRIVLKNDEYYFNNKIKEIDMEKSNKEMLAELIQKHPDLPVVFFCPADLEYNKTMLKDFRVEVQQVYEADDYVYDCYDDVFEYLASKLEDECKDMDDRTFYAYIEHKVSELNHYEAIAVDILE